MKHYQICIGGEKKEGTSPTTSLCSSGTQQLKRFVCHSRATLTHTPTQTTLTHTEQDQSKSASSPPTNNSKCVKVTDVGEEGREEKSLAWWVTFRLYCTLRGTLVITPLTESSTRSLPPPHHLSLPLLCSSFTQQPNASYRLPTHIQRHIGASRDWQCLQTLKHMSTYTQTHTFALQGWQ